MKISDVSENKKSIVTEQYLNNQAPAKKLRLSIIGRNSSSKSLQNVKRTKAIIVSSDDDMNETKSTKEVGSFTVIMISGKERFST